MTKYWPAIILAIFFGAIGLQEFYVKNIFRGVLALLFCWTLIPAVVALIQICYWLCIGEEQFNEIYNGTQLYRNSKKAKSHRR